MLELKPVYTVDNCVFSCPLQWGLTIFWRDPEPDEGWLEELGTATEFDGIRILSHEFTSPGVSQFLVSTQPDVSPILVVQRVKGRLQYLVKHRKPKPFRRNYAIRSIGAVTRDTIESYVANQLEHHPMADPQVQARLMQYQIENHDIDLAEMQKTSHGVYWYNLHLVIVRAVRWMEVHHQVLQRVKSMVAAASDCKAFRLSRAGILPDHLHLVLGCPINVAPTDVMLGYLNNLAFVHEMKPVFQFGGFIGTVGEYTTNAVVDS